MSWRRIAKAPKFPRRIATDRLVLRPYRYGDADELCSYANDAEWSRFITPPYPDGRENADIFIEERIHGHGNEWVGWCIEYGDRMAGSIDLILDTNHRSAEIAYSLARKHWNKGLITEAAGATIEAAFTIDRPLNRLFARIDTRNEPSARVANKLGLKQEGVLKQSRFHKGDFIDEAIFAILRDDWKMTRPLV